VIYQFDTPHDDEGRQAATAALLVYAIYRSRDKRKFKVSPEMWGQIERFTKASAKRARDLHAFIESLKPRLCCPTINPKWVEVGATGRLVALGDGSFAEFPGQEQREFLTGVLNDADHRQVVDTLYRKTSWVIALVRDRLEREKPIESQFEKEIPEESL
jgi:hypothetical protein